MVYGNIKQTMTIQIVLPFKILVCKNLRSTFNSKVARGSDLGYFNFIFRMI
jgi:hypothetical protein